MKIVVYANCQATPFGECIREFLPDSQVIWHHFGIGDTPGCDDADLIFAHPDIAERLQLSPDPRIRLFPAILFTGFHPDCTYIFQDGKTIHSPIGPYSSSLIAACFLKNIAASEVPSWFNNDVYEAIGFFK